MPELPAVSGHYFTGAPATVAERRTTVVSLASREVEVEVASGVFSPGRLDPGTAVLLRSVPAAPPEDHLLDLGCGWGPIALSMALQSPDATIWAVDISERALDLTRRNATRLGLANVRVCLPADVPTDVAFAAIWSNPPIRVGKAMLHDLLRTWLPRLAQSDATDASGAWLVVAKQLGADSLARWITNELGLECTRAATDKGYRVLHVRR